MLYACDVTWWHQHGGLPRFEGEKWTQDDCALVYPTIRYIRSVDEPGLSFNRAIIHQGSNGGYQAVNLAVHYGVKRILLIGYDMKEAANGAKHWHPPHAENNPNRGNFNGWLRAFKTLPPDLEKAGVELINCTRDTALDCFPKARLEDVL